MKKNILTLIVWGLFCNLMMLSLHAQTIERNRPLEWRQLVPGGRFMDRFLPMADGRQMNGVWGTDSVQNRYVDNGIELPNISFWGGNILQGTDGQYHLFVCGWPENAPKGHMSWYNSTTFHAVSNSLSGPYRLKNSIGKGHNPEAFRLADGRIVIYVIDGYYLAENENSPVWVYNQFVFDARGRKIIEGLSNLTFTRRQDGSYLMVCRGGGVWISRDGLSPYRQISNQRIYPAVDGCFEDPVVWRDSLQYHLIVNDWMGRIAYYQRSKDGLHWITEPGEAYMPGIAMHSNGQVENWFKYERPKVFQDPQGRVEQINFAVIDTIKWEDLPNDRHSSKNICIPLNKGLLLDVLNTDRITPRTKVIKVRIKAEDDFDPSAEVDVLSLRFGSCQEVNYGRGCKPLRSYREGRDLVIVFEGKGNGIAPDEFAPKLIGKDLKGKLLFGYARLPYVDYTPALLSASRPIYDEEDKQIDILVENFGLGQSQPAEVEVMDGNRLVGTARIPSLMPYSSTVLSFPAFSSVGACYRVVIYDGERNVLENTTFDAK